MGNTTPNKHRQEHQKAFSHLYEDEQLYYQHLILFEKKIQANIPDGLCRDFPLCNMIHVIYIKSSTISIYPLLPSIRQVYCTWSVPLSSLCINISTISDKKAEKYCKLIKTDKRNTFLWLIDKGLITINDGKVNSNRKHNFAWSIRFR